MTKKGFRKTFWKKVKLLKMSNFTFFHNVFFAICIFKSFNPFPNKPWFLRVCSTSLLKTLWEKEKLLITSNFSFSHSVFYPPWKLSAIFIKFKIVICKRLPVWKSLKFVVWERVKHLISVVICSFFEVRRVSKWRIREPFPRVLRILLRSWCFCILNFNVCLLK